MKITHYFRRSAAAVILATGLAYPACAAVCPKGIGGCTSPGRCFLFVDADANTLCDYTGRSGTTSASSGFSGRPSAPQQAPVQAPATAAPVPATDPSSVVQVTTTTSAQTSPESVLTSAGTPITDASTQAVQHATSAASTQASSLVPIIAGILLFLCLTGTFWFLIRRGTFGVREEKPLPALALAALPALCVSLAATGIQAGESLAGTTLALVWIGAGSIFAGYLWYTGTMKRRIVVVLAILSTFLGVVLGAPVMPQEIGGLVSVLTGASALTAGIAIIAAVLILAIVFGRVFCGSVCPVGSLQELAYSVPVPKWVVKRIDLLELARLVIFIITVFAAVYLIDLMAVTGLYELFTFTVSTGFIIAVALMVVAAFVYRPVCRLLCPFGVLFAIPAEFSLFRLRRTETCISCRRCEKACPARTAGKDDAKRECYLCGRCTEACPDASALTYRR